MKEEKKAIEALRKIKTILDKNKINYWLDEGTILGAVREKKLIEWDHDIDLSIWYKDLDKIKPLFDEINKTGVQVCFFEGKKHVDLVGNGFKIDINLYHLEEDKATQMWYEQNKFGDFLDYFIWILHIKNANTKESKVPLLITIFLVKIANMIPKSFNQKISKGLFKLYKKKGSKPVPMAIPSYFFTDLTDLEFYNMTFKVPKKTKEYLEYRYGLDWRTPKRDYIYNKDDLSIVK
jgi:lipopolysaccharide cholinephosphotransferase